MLRDKPAAELWAPLMLRGWGDEEEVAKDSAKEL